MCRTVCATTQTLQLGTPKDPYSGLCITLPFDATQLCQRDYVCQGQGAGYRGIVLHCCW